MIRLICPLLLISTILCATGHADTKTPTPAKSFRFTPPGNIKAGAYDVKLETKNGTLGSVSGSKGLLHRFRVDMASLADYTVTVTPANKKQEQVLELTCERLQESTIYNITAAKKEPVETGTSFDSRHPKQARGVECIDKRMSVMGKKSRWTLCKGELVKRDGFEQLRHKAELPASAAADREAKVAAYHDAASANRLIDRGEAMFPQLPRTLLPTKPATVGDTWNRKVDIVAWMGPWPEDVSIPSKATCTLSEVKGTVATVTFSLEIPPCNYTLLGMHAIITGKERGKGSLQYDLATQLVMTSQVAFTIESVPHVEVEGPHLDPSTMQFQHSLTISPKKAKTKAKAAPPKKPTN